MFLYIKNVHKICNLKFLSKYVLVLFNDAFKDFLSIICLY